MSTTDHDPLEELEQLALRLEEQAAQLVSTARAKLVLGKDAAHAFFATLALKLEPVPCWDIDTAATDGKRLLYNPEWFGALGLDHAKGVVSHEVLHNVLAHPARLQHRNHAKFNVAADLAINPLVLEAGLQLPDFALLPGKRPTSEQHFPPAWADAIAAMKPGLSAEEYYSQLPDLTGEGDDPGSEGDDAGSLDPGGMGGVQPPGDGSQAASQEQQAEWEVAAAQARQVARQRGNLPGGLSQSIEGLLAPKVSWKEVLRQFVSAHARNDYAWYPPNRRFVHLGLYLPGLRSEELGEIVVAVDTSGSIGQDELTRFASEVQGILEAYDCTLTILYHDSAIQHVQTWKSTDGPLVLEARGGGGTSHVPVFDHIDQSGTPPTCLVCLTDLYSSFPSQGPGYPVLWAVVGNEKATAPFGQIVGVNL